MGVLRLLLSLIFSLDVLTLALLRADPRWLHKRALSSPRADASQHPGDQCSPPATLGARSRRSLPAHHPLGKYPRLQDLSGGESRSRSRSWTRSAQPQPQATDAAPFSPPPGDDGSPGRGGGQFGEHGSGFQAGESERGAGGGGGGGGEEEEEAAKPHTGDTGAPGGWTPTHRDPRGAATVLHFSGRREQLERLGQVDLPRGAFTAELWLKPQGGQSIPAVIAGLFDNCSHSLSDKGWIIGIQSVEYLGNKDPRLFFSLRTDRARKATTIFAYQRYHVNTWTHVAASYDGHHMMLYVNGAKVGGSTGQLGNLHSAFMSSCRTLMIGGDNSDSGHNFRGYIASFRLLKTAKSQEKFKRDYYQSIQEDESSLTLFADWSKMEDHWKPGKDSRYPSWILMHLPEPELVSPLTPPSCGLTVCDNVEIIKNYNSSWSLRAKKTIQYRVINIYDNNRQYPTVTKQQIELQHQALNEAFSKYNITWQLSITEVLNTTIRNRVVLVNCEKSKIGNDNCEPECDHPLTGYDGGDCRFQGRCYVWKRGDGICNMECNNVLDDFDDDDCCDPSVTDVRKTCFDPDSPERAYMSVKELKETLLINGSMYLNVYFANSVREELAGAATWPWDKEALSYLGGVVLNPSYYGRRGHTNTMIHELGHILGLYHVFKGVSEKESCDDPCRETVPSLETGDLCADTAPTPKSKLCRDPDPVNDTCGPMQYYKTPFNNYMSYTDDGCTNNFTPNQVARMHCYLDLVYLGWIHSKKPALAPIPVAPEIIAQTVNSVTIHWLPPISGMLYEREVGAQCGDCGEYGTLFQYAHIASSPRVCDSSGYWTPKEAVGTPDVDEPCEPSLHAWNPELHLYHMNMTVPCPQPDGCMLELHFPHAVIADSLTVWVTYMSTSTDRAISNIKILTSSGEHIELGAYHVFCDIPLTVKLNIKKKVIGVRIYTFDEKMELDAAMLASKSHDPLCFECKPIKYKIIRIPPFQRGPWVTVTQLKRTFTDKEVLKGKVYKYQVKVVADSASSELSPVLNYMHGGPYCGDQRVQRSIDEDCDDGNLIDGDGCSRKCLTEPNFNCVGEPSLCYVYDGDGVCEEFERRSSIRDCGLPTPEGFTDQWAAQASSSHQDDRRCPVKMVTGEPAISKGCRNTFLDVSDGLSQYAWFPCTAPFYKAAIENINKPFSYHNLGDEDKLWLKVCFDRPGVATSIIIYLSADGTTLYDQHRKSVAVQLTDTNGHNHTVGVYELNCHRNPLVVNITHNLSLPFYRTASVLLNFSSPLVAVSAVALRTYSYFSSHTISTCAKQEAHKQRRQSYVQCSCGQERCEPLALNHGTVNCTVGSSAKMECHVACKRGFSLKTVCGQQHLDSLRTATSLTCNHGKWDRTVICDPIDCGIPDQSHVYYARFSCPKGTTFGKHCTFSCNLPAKLQGENHSLMCMEDGLWSFPEAYCKVECTAPPPIANAKLLVPRCQQGGHNVGSVCRYKCKPGYYVHGSNRTTKKRFLKLRCLEGGQWELGSCNPVLCDPPPPVFNGMYNCTNGFEFDSQCTLNCKGQADRVPIRCSKDGSWTEEFRLCEGEHGDCQPPPEVNLVEYSCNEGYAIGAVCALSCVIPPTDAVVLPSNVTADNMEHWMEATKVQNIVCTGILRWYPDPHLIHCIQSCEPFQGDGWCDTINNRAYCQYDGGDCCPSTLSSRKVIPFAADCDQQEECTCRDPNAEENLQKQGGLEVH